MFEVVLYQPEIPPNTGNIIRLCANTGCRLHLIEPLGFTMEAKQLRRAGLDYHEYASVQTWPDWESFLVKHADRRLLAFSTRFQKLYSEFEYQAGDLLLFGSEGKGLSEAARASVEPEQRLTLPMRPGNRSLNLANSVAVVVYEGWRQLEFSGCAGE
ncbi:MAG: tRNA (cytidine(34)-2'-O)-methyltransferase [Pseudomonadota bacterium]|nr:tRNA (cytidine(34)-2'-O)-methyltransferase [Pseudomonadota bacterium]